MPGDGGKQQGSPKAGGGSSPRSRRGPKPKTAPSERTRTRVSDPVGAWEFALLPWAPSEQPDVIRDGWEPMQLVSMAELDDEEKSWFVFVRRLVSIDE